VLDPFGGSGTTLIAAEQAESRTPQPSITGGPSS